MKKYNKGFTLIEVLMSIVIVSVFSLLVLVLNKSIRSYQISDYGKYRLINHYYNILQIVKSDPTFYECVDKYYYLEDDNPYYLYKTSDGRHVLSIYFDKFGELSNQANAYYIIYITIRPTDYGDYCNYYYTMKITLSKEKYNKLIYSGGTFYVSKKN